MLVSSLVGKDGSATREIYKCIDEGGRLNGRLDEGTRGLVVRHG